VTDAVAPATPGPVARWVEGARPKTLPAAIVPVVVGLGVVRPGPIAWDRAILAAVVALSLQIGTNFANDYSDGIRGTDEDRVGPVRLVGQRLASPGSVKAAAFISFGVAAACGLALAAMTSWWLIPVGLAAFLAGWFYTGGPQPYGYLGFGELFVFIFFGVVATVGSAYVQGGHLIALSWVAAIPVGLLATAMLEANNLRDIDGDVVAGKRTLAVRLGRRRAGWLFVGSYLGAGVAIICLSVARPPAALGLLGLLAAIPSCRLALSGASGRSLLPMLKASGRAQLLVGALLAIGLAL
jgi:1,4-dihydroxy-2-naphthoate polyprenyltransferase